MTTSSNPDEETQGTSATTGEITTAVTTGEDSAATPSDAVDEPSPPTASADAGSSNRLPTEPSSKSQPPPPKRNKRTAEIQLNKDDHPEGDNDPPSSRGDDDDDENGDRNDEGGKRSDPFQRASEDVLKKRKIVRAKRTWGGGGGSAAAGAATASSNPFAAVRLTGQRTEVEGGGSQTKEAEAEAESPTKATSSTTPIFGAGAKIPTFGSAAPSSGFGAGFAASGGGGFGTVSSFRTNSAAASHGDAVETTGTDSGKSSSAFGGGFGAVSAGFGTVLGKKVPPGSAGGAASDGLGTSSSTPADDASGGADLGGFSGAFAYAGDKPTNAGNVTSKTTFPANAMVDISNGEENEVIVFEVRSKLFKMVKCDDASKSGNVGGDGGLGGVSQGDILVPSVPSTTGRMELVTNRKNDEKERKQENNEGANDKEEAKGQGTVSAPEMEWKEAGIGKTRVLKRKASFSLPSSSNGNHDNETDNGKETEPTQQPDKQQKISVSARIVVRREPSGTVVLLNAPLIPGVCKAERLSEKQVRLCAPLSGESAGNGTMGNYLFRVKTKEEADGLMRNLEDILKEED